MNDHTRRFSRARQQPAPRHRERTIEDPSSLEKARSPDSETDASEHDYEVGYGRPPKHTQFKKGQSGNPRGRPKGARNLETILESELDRAVTVTEGGKKRKVSAQHAVVMTVVAKALRGDLRAVKQLVDLIEKYRPVAADDSSEPSLRQDDLQLLSNFVEEETAKMARGQSDEQD